jgi:hypothetical protein
MNKIILTALVALSPAAFIGDCIAQGSPDTTWINSGSDIYYSPKPDTITVNSVNYSAENGGPSSTCGIYVQSQCNGKTSCTYTGSDSTCGVKSPPGQKNYLFVTYSCGENLRSERVESGASTTFTKQADAGVPAKISCPGIGDVGVGTELPEAKLDVKGEVKFGNTASVCSLATEGQQRYNLNLHGMEYCDGKSWTAYLTGASIANIEKRLAAVETNVKKIDEACNSIDFNLRTEPVGFKCISKEGLYFERVSKDKFGEAWKDPDGTIWGDVLPDYLSLDDANKKCKDMSGILPSLDDYQREAKKGLLEVLPNAEDWMWTSTPESDTSNWQMMFYGDQDLPTGSWAASVIIPPYDQLRGAQPPPTALDARCISK